MTIETISTVQSVDRALNILETLSKRDSMSLMELSEETRLHKATAHRLVNTLLANGYIEKDPFTKRYSVSLKLVELGNHRIQNIDFLNIAKSMIQQLALELNQTVHLVIENNDEILYIDKHSANNQDIRMKSKIGQTAPMHCTAVGKTLLAARTNTEITEYWENNTITAFTPHTIVDLKTFLKEIEEVRRLRYAMDNEEHELGVVCVGAAFSSYADVTAGAFSVTIPPQELDNKEFYIEKVLQTAERTSQLLGAF